MYIILEVFSFDGKWYAFFDAGEYNYDGSVDRMEVTGPIIFNADGNKIYSELVEDWFMIVDGNRLEFTECDHVFADDARCIYCGYREGGYTDKECDHVFDEKGCCVYCGMYVNFGTTCNHVDNDINYICDMCGVVIGEVAVCNHVLDASGRCIYCGVIFDYVITYQHIDNNLDGMCDNCGLMMNGYEFDAGVDLPEYEYTYGTGNNDYATVTP